MGKSRIAIAVQRSTVKKSGVTLGPLSTKGYDLLRAQPQAGTSTAGTATSAPKGAAKTKRQPLEDCGLVGGGHVSWGYKWANFAFSWLLLEKNDHLNCFVVVNYLI